MNNYVRNDRNSKSIVNRLYTKQEVLHVINTMNKNSAMGFDFIHYKLVYWSKETIIDNLVLLFNLCFVRHQKCPDLLKYGEYIPVHKP